MGPLAQAKMLFTFRIHLLFDFCRLYVNDDRWIAQVRLTDLAYSASLDLALVTYPTTVVFELKVRILKISGSIAL